MRSFLTINSFIMRNMPDLSFKTTNNVEVSTEGEI